MAALHHQGGPRCPCEWCGGLVRTQTVFVSSQLRTAKISRARFCLLRQEGREKGACTLSARGGTSTSGVP